MTTEPPDGETEQALLAGRYRLGPVLGRGGAAVVRRAVDERLQRQVAVKAFRPDLEGEADLARRFESEARLLARLRHPGLVEIFDYGDTPQGPYLVLELVAGPTLRRRLASSALSLREVLVIGMGLSRALACVHRAGVVHRDVKPSNILFDGESMPRLADFGMSRVLDGAGITRSGAVVGTAAYLAPEQVVGDSAGPAADVYALGLVLIECLTGVREYPGPPMESAVARLHRDPAIPAGLPSAVSRILREMTARDPDMRPTAERCAGAFEDAAASPSPMPPREIVGIAADPDAETKDLDPLPEPDTAVFRRVRSAAVIGGAAAAVVLGGVLLIGSGPDDTSARTPASPPSPTSTLTGAPRAPVTPQAAADPASAPTLSTPMPSSQAQPASSASRVEPASDPLTDKEGPPGPPGKTKKDKGPGHGSR